MQEASLAAATPETATDGPGASLFAVGRNCWRVERADRLAFLVDGEEYFGAVRAALAKARQSIFILGWDIDSRDAPRARGRERRTCPSRSGDS